MTRARRAQAQELPVAIRRLSATQTFRLFLELAGASATAKRLRWTVVSGARSASWTLLKWILNVLPAFRKDDRSLGVPDYAAATSEPEAPVPSDDLARTRTSTIRITDKRRRPDPAALDDQGFSGKSVPPDDPKERRRSSRVGRWLARHVTHCLGGLVYFACEGRIPLPPRTESSYSAGRAIVGRVECRLILLDKDLPCWQSVLSLLEPENASDLGDWRSTVLWWIRRHVARSDLAKHVHHVLCESSSSTKSALTLAFHLNLAVETIPVLSSRHAADLFDFAIGVARSRIDPYSYSGRELAARKLVPALLKSRPELDKKMLVRLKLLSPLHPAPAGTQLPYEMSAFSLGVRGRPHHLGIDFARAATAANLSPEQLETAARIADSLSPPPRFLRQMRRGSLLMGRLHWLRIILPWISAPVVALSVAIAANRLSWDVEPIKVGLAEAIALIALLVTANVVTVELSASRLPGMIARVAGRPWPLLFSYSSSVTLFAALILGPHVMESARTQSAFEWVSVAALALQISSLLAALFLLLRRTDAAQASSGYVREVLSTARAVGRRLGIMQALSLTMTGGTEASPSVVRSFGRVPGEWAIDVRAGRRGFLNPSRSNLESLLKRGELAEGLRLRLVAGIGTVVEKDDVVAALLPAEDQAVTAGFERAARKAFRTTECVRAEKIAAGVVALVETAVDQAERGDIGTARSIAQDAAHLMSVHLTSARRARSQRQYFEEWRSYVLSFEGRRHAVRTSIRPQKLRSEDDLAPVNLALRDVINAAMAAHVRRHSRHFNLRDSLISPLVEATGEADGAVAMLIYAIPSDSVELAETRGACLDLHRLAGVEALRLGSRSLFGQVLGRLETLAKTQSALSGTLFCVSALAAVAAAFNIDRSRDAIRAVQNISDAAGEDALGEQLAALWRIGAAGLACGSVSIAVISAKELARLDLLDAAISLGENNERLVSEAFWAKMHGSYLGDSGEDSLIGYSRFLESIAAIFRPSVPTA